MSPLTPAPKALADTSAIVRLYGSLLILVIVAGALLSIVALRTKEIEDWRRDLRSTSFLLTEHTSQTIFSAFLVLDAITERVSPRVSCCSGVSCTSPSAAATKKEAQPGG